MSQNTVKDPLTVNGSNHPGRSRRRDLVENDAYTAFLRRAIRAAGRRVGDGDVEGLPDLASLGNELDHALSTAVHALRADYGYSWAEIASRLGITRQAAQQRWGTGMGGDL